MRRLDVRDLARRAGRGVMAVVPGVGRRRPGRSSIGAKKFTESVILAEMGTPARPPRGAAARRDDLGGTPACGWR